MSTTVEKPKGLYAKLAEVMGEVGRVEKRGFNDFHKYAYATEADLLEEVRSKLSSKGIVMFPSVASVVERPAKTEKGKDTVITTVHMKFSFVDSDTGEVHVAEWAGAGDDASDKGLYKAYTGAIKYFLMKTFLIPTGDDPEGHGSHSGAGQSASNGHGRNTPSDKQLDFLVSLAKQNGAGGPDQEMIRAYAAENLTGGKEGSTSKAIEKLKDEGGAFLVKFATAAAEWQSAQPDVPADTEGLPMDEDPSYE